MHILVVEDEVRLAETLKEILKTQKYTCDLVYDGEDGLAYAESGIYDVILLDIMLPKMNGFDVVRTLRSKKVSTPVILLTARDEVTDKVKGLDCGADYYLTKPFGVMELVSCVKAVLRRCQPKRESHALSCGGLVLDPDAHTVTADGQRVVLTYKEYELLRLFLSNPGIAFTRDQLMDRVWGMDYGGETRTVDTHILTLRQKLGGYGRLIKTVRNVGYRLEADDK